MKTQPLQRGLHNHPGTHTGPFDTGLLTLAAQSSRGYMLHAHVHWRLPPMSPWLVPRYEPLLFWVQQASHPPTTRRCHYRQKPTVCGGSCLQIRIPSGMNSASLCITAFSSSSVALLVCSYLHFSILLRPKSVDSPEQLDPKCFNSC